jgi:FkbM family methyltransferase
VRLTGLFKPEFLFRPSQIARRCIRPFRKHKSRVRLPWQSEVFAEPRDIIGRNVLGSGVLELEICESIFRVLDKGEIAVDAGANIGVMTSAMARAVGPTGCVFAFEPNPHVLEQLRESANRWDGRLHAPVRISHYALSDQHGQSVLHIPHDSVGNVGLATFLDRGFDSTDQSVTTMLLDDLIEPAQRIGLMKIDVEGHEAEVLGGCSRLLSSKSIRDIVCEDFFHVFPNRATELLTQSGYVVFRLSRSFWGPILLPPESAGASPTFIATADPDRLRKRFATRGWRSLHVNP